MWRRGRSASSTRRPLTRAIVLIMGSIGAMITGLLAAAMGMRLVRRIRGMSRGLAGRGGSGRVLRDGRGDRVRFYEGGRNDKLDYSYS